MNNSGIGAPGIDNEPADDDFLVAGEVDERLYALLVDVTGPCGWGYDDVADLIREWLSQHTADDIDTDPVQPSDELDLR